jgi:cystathionine beta-lyase/cystathionine gamma-synthase
MLRPGDHVIASNDLYGGTYRLFTQVFAPFNIDFSFVDMTHPEAVEQAITPNTKLVWIETPTNPLLNIVDIKHITDLARDCGAVSFVDNTFASPYLQRPLELGADAVLYSTTKYLGGHSDVIGGAVASSHKKIMENLRFQVKTTGGVPGPMDCYLTLRGIKTLSLRVQRSCDNARAITSWLAERPEVGDLRYPGLESHPGHEIAARQMADFGGMVSFSLKDDAIESAHTFMSNTKLFTLAESLGGVESLVSHPASMTHGSIPADVRHKAGLKDSLIRLSLGIEDADDLIDDLDRAFAALKN